MRKRKASKDEPKSCDHEARNAIWQHYAKHGAPRIKALAIRVLAETGQANARKES